MSKPGCRVDAFYILSVLIIVALLVPGSRYVYGADQKSSESGYKWKIDDLITSSNVEEYQISNDGKWLVWTVSQWNVEKQSKYQIVYLSSLDKKGEDIQFTRDESTYFDLRWTPDGKKISFKTNRKFKDTKPENIWLMSLTGGDPYPVTQSKKGVGQYEWIDADTLLLSAVESDTLLAQQIEEQKDTSEVVEDEDHQPINRLFLYNIKTKKTTRLTGNKKPIISISLSKDKKNVVYGVSMSILFGQDQKIRPKYFMLNLETKESREILTGVPCLIDGRINWEKDGKGFYFSGEYSTHAFYTQATVTKLFYFDLGANRFNEVNLDWDRYLLRWGNSIQVTPDGFIAQLLNGVHFKYARYVRDGDTWKRYWIEDKECENMQVFVLSPDAETLVYRYSTASLPPRYYVARLKGNKFVKQFEVMDIKSPLFQKPLAKSEVRTWKGANNETIEGVLYYPFNYDPAKKYPLVLMIHGGPNYADMDEFSDTWIYPAHMYCERGVFVLKPNYHGSTNYDLAFGESIAGHYYELEVPDIEAGVDMLIGEGKVDKDKLGLMGHSNGAILAIALTVSTDRYKVASVMAGDVNWTSDFGNCSFGVSFDTYYFLGAPWEKVEHYIQKSPLFKMDKVVTPTLIFHGDKDRSVPYSQGWEHYRALQVIGKVPVRFISFPGEGHVPVKIAHQRRKVTEDLTWFEKYLFNNYKAKNGSLKKGSPLDMLAKTLAISKNSLVPDMVDYENLKVGRFEVTRAQWANFDKSYIVEAGTGDYPVTGITYEQAKQYAEWLSKETGNVFRLPDEEEAKVLYKKAVGNTFDYWAGYEVNPDDYNNLLEELKKYGDKPVLLKPVGSFAPDSEVKDWVYDLGGNAAEWVSMKSGKGKAYGGSAVTIVDERGEYSPLPQYIGFRLIMNQPKK